MRKELSKALKETFGKDLMEELPRFQESSLKSMYLGPGERVFEWRHAEDARLFVILVPHQKGADEFTVELGWSTLGRFPELVQRPSMLPPRREGEFREAEYVCRLGDLARGKDHWWTVGGVSATPAGTVEGTLAMLQEGLKPMPLEEARRRVRPSVEEAIADLKRHGIPYLEDWLARRS